MTTSSDTEYLYRRNTVLEALRGHRRELHRLWLQEDARQVGEVISAAQARGVPIDSIDKGRLSTMIGDGSHQGVVLEAGPYQYSTIDAILNLAEEWHERPFLLLLDLLHGPQNIGTLLRAAEACGVHGVVFKIDEHPISRPR